MEQAGSALSREVPLKIDFCADGINPPVQIHVLSISLNSLAGRRGTHHDKLYSIDELKNCTNVSR